MNHRDSPLYWSLPCGTWFWTRVRISVFFPLLIIVLLIQHGVELGLAFGAILFLSVLVHEFGHIAAAKQSGGSGDEILIWPLGGLAFVQPGPTLAARVWTSAAGPLVNFLICAITFWPVLQSDHIAKALNPLTFPLSELSKDQLLLELLVLMFSANYLLLLVNLIPVYPLDAGQIVRAVLASRLGGETGSLVYVRIGLFVAFIMMFAGLIFDSAMLVFVGGIVLVLNVQETFQMRVAEAYDESFMGYDFSQGYTSLERSEAPRPERPKKPGLVQQFLERRRAARLRRQQEREREAEVQLDALLEKVHAHGIESLTEAERRLLHDASNRYKNKGKE
ncbi:MAG: M50 family metallopeptidase [Planctomycetaceae bacterium]